MTSGLFVKDVLEVKSHFWGWLAMSMKSNPTLRVLVDYTLEVRFDFDGLANHSPRSGI